MSLETIVADLVQKIERRFYGKYRGFVVDNADTEHLGRLKLKVPSVLGNEVVTGWAMPCVPFGGEANQGFLFIPEVGAGVWVEFEEGDLEFPIWVGTFWSKPGGESELPKPDDAGGAEQGSVQDPPTRKIIKTPKGHTIQFEDKDGEEMVIIKDGEHGQEIVLDNSGVTISDKNGNKIILGSGGIQIGSSRATEPLVLGNRLKTALDNWVNTVFAAHVHTGNLGAPTTPPLPGAPLLLGPALSPNNKVE